MRSRSRLRRNALLRACLIPGLLVLAACTTKPISVDSEGYEAAYSSEWPPDPVSCEAMSGRDRHILALSSGGADGAVGAGVLVGWTQTGQRPIFDVVTGVSTGALQATHAFLGSSHDQALTQAFTQSRAGDILSGNGIMALKRPGLSSLRPLRAKLDRIVTEQLLDEVAAQHRLDRRLYIATTEF